MKSFGWFAIGSSIILGIALIAFGSVCSIQFKQNCSGHLKRAADANTVALAKQELGTAVRYIEQAGLTSGSTHILYAMPDCDLDFWHANLKASLEELETIPADADQLTVSNQLLKLRETIMDTGKSGTRVTAPPNVHVFPNQRVFRALGIANLAACSVGFVTLAVAYDDKTKSKSSCCV